METRDMPPLRRAQWKKKFFPYLLMSPTLLLVLIFLIIPLAFAFTAPIPMRLYAILQIHGAAKLCRRLNGPGISWRLSEDPFLSLC